MECKGVKDQKKHREAAREREGDEQGEKKRGRGLEEEVLGTLLGKI